MIINNGIMEKILLNRFDMSHALTGFVDNFSHMVVSVGHSLIELSALSARGLIEWRSEMAEPLVRLQFAKSGCNGSMQSFYVRSSKFLPWLVEQDGEYIDGDDCISVRSRLYSPEFNKLVWCLDMSFDGAVVTDYSFKLLGKLLCPEKPHSLTGCEDGVVCSFNADMKQSKYINSPQTDSVLPCWSIRCADGCTADIDVINKEYVLDLGVVSLTPGQTHRICVQIDYAHVFKEEVSSWKPGTIVDLGLIEEHIRERRDDWIRMIRPIADGKGDTIRKSRCAAAMLRCGFEWHHDDRQRSIIASYCSITSWSSTAFFWDSIISSMGLAQFNLKCAQDALRAIFVRQRPDGCVPTHSYEHELGSTFYPQAPFAAWAIVKMLDQGIGEDFVREMLPKLDHLYDWFIDTQDHDGDGLYEWRFSGSVADDSPLYDHYAEPIHSGSDAIWNIYLPPIASVSLNSYLIMEAKCLAYLHGLIGNVGQTEKYLQRAGEIEKRLIEICLADDGVFYDYDHHTGCHNRALTLYSFLPIWAGVELDTAHKQCLINDYLLSSKHFWGDYPFPHLAFSEECYDPKGYWRGRIWPHTTLWMLELLCSNGYTMEAEEAAGRLLAMMNQREEVLENYNSDKRMPGGGSSDFCWSLSTFLLLQNKAYAKPLPFKKSQGG